MNIYLTRNNFKHILELKSISLNKEEDITNYNCRCILELFNAKELKLYIDSEWYSEILKIMSEETEEKRALLDLDFKSHYQRLVCLAIRNNRLYEFSDNLKTPLNFNGYYFLDKINVQDSSFVGIIAKDLNYNASEFYDECNKLIDNIQPGEYSKLRKHAPDCSSLIIVDSYIFTGNLNLKLENLKAFVQSFIKDGQKIDFQLTILCSNENNRKLITTHAMFERALNHLSLINGIAVQIYIDNTIPTDRTFYTNYSWGVIGHPFDRPTYFNQHFLGREARSEKINENYLSFIRQIKRWNQLINGIPLLMGRTKLIYQNKEFKNRIFDICTG